MKPYRYPTGAELYALEQMARRERARVQAELLIAAAQWVKDLFKKHPSRKVAFHG